MLMTESKIREIIGQEIENKKYQRMMNEAVPPGGSGGWPLKQGSEGRWVSDLQGKLGIAADGIFGPDTEAALIASPDHDGSPQITREQFRDLLGMTTLPGVNPSEPQQGSLSGAEIELLNTTLATTEGIEIPEDYKKPGSPDLRDFWPAWAQFLLLHYEPRLFDPETSSRIEGALDPREVYSKWDEIAQEQLGYEGTDVGAIQFIRALGEPKAPSAMADLIREKFDLTKMGEYIREKREALTGKVQEMQGHLGFPVMIGDMKNAASVLASVIENDSPELIDTRIFNGIYAVENLSWQEMLGDMAIGAGLVMAAPLIATFGATAALAAGVKFAAGAGAALQGLFTGRSITAMIEEGFEEEGAILTSLNSDEMAADIGNTQWSKPEGVRLKRAMVEVAEKIANDHDGSVTKESLLEILREANIISESAPASLTGVIDMLIREVAMTVPDPEIPPFGSPPFDAEAAAEEEEEEEDAEGTGVGRVRRGRGAYGSGQAALAGADAADVVAAAGAPGAYSRAQTRQERQRQRTARTDIRQAGRTQRAGQRQGARAERRDQRGERQAARGERRADRVATRRGARADRVQGRRDAAATRRAERAEAAEAAE